MTATPDEVLLLLHPAEPLLLVADGGPGPVPGEAFRPLGPERQAGPDGPPVMVGVARDPAPPGGRWAARPPRGWPEAVARVAEVVLAEDAGTAPVPALRRAWMRRGWWPRATAWCDAALPPGLERTADLEPVCHWPTSSVARVPTTAGPCWFKAVPPYFAREPAVLAVLGAVLPGRVPVLLASERMPDGGALLLLADAGDLPDEVDDDERTDLAALLAGLQAATLPVLDRLAAAGAADRSPAALAADLGRTVADGVIPGLLTAAERAALAAAVPALTAELDRVAAATAGLLPAVLGHGDFHAWNVLRAPDGGPGRVVIDWTDASLGPPGLDLAALHSWEAPSSARLAARDRYVTALAAATGHPAAALDRAVRAAATAARVVQVLAHEEIVAGTEPDARWSYTRYAGHWLRELIPPAC